MLLKCCNLSYLNVELSDSPRLKIPVIKTLELKSKYNNFQTLIIKIGKIDRGVDIEDTVLFTGV